MAEKRKKLFHCLLLALGLVSALAEAGTLFAIKRTDVDFLLVTIDTVTFEVTEVGPLQTQYLAGGLGWDPQNEKLYMVNALDNYLWSINPDTGRADIIGEHHAQSFNISLESLAYHCADKLLYSTTYRGHFLSIDPNDASVERLNNSLNQFPNDHISALAYNFKQDALLGIRIDQARLFRLDWLKQGKMTLLADLEDGFGRYGLAYDPDLNRYWAVNEAGQLLSLDPSDFKVTVHRNDLGRLDGLAYRHNHACEERAFRINFGLTDAWFDPASPGQGFFVNVMPDVDVFFLGWFTYDLERPADPNAAILGEAGHRWLTAQGAYFENTATLKIYQTEGGLFDEDEPPPETEEYGEMNITFEDCQRATVEYSIPGLGLADSIEIARISNDRVPFCIEQEFFSQPD